MNCLKRKKLDKIYYSGKILVFFSDAEQQLSAFNYYDEFYSRPK